MSHHFDRACEVIASRQHGVIARFQALEAGMSERQIDYRVASGRWVAIHPGIYLIGGTPNTWFQQVAAACLWARTGYASHRTAAALWGLPGFVCEGPLIDVTVATCRLPPRSGLHVHFTNRILAADVKARRNIPTSCIERTLLDLGAVSKEKTVAIAVDQAVRKGLTTIDRLERYRRTVAKQGRNGCGVLRGVLEPRLGLKELPNSALETLFFQLQTCSSIPTPVLQYEIWHKGRFVARPDFAWPDRKKALEMDGFDPHGGYEGFNHDRARLTDMALARWGIMHGTWREATRDPDGLVRRVEEFLQEDP